ncbi:oxidoreductase [Agaricicola taiwanensis]|uniref:Oxidoreductase n=1 Tax=Agaricicola taiwanensis TaxID=591372 RepID=A0A8J3DW02_9RHOB|nr:SDR family oxidoreductase [Agaricicola taiwanensis]GGE48564.1 oxidoreductase [Agaricicola taiwanensis]
MRLQGKAGLITAAASGMGLAGALRFAEEGASVAVVDRDHGAAEAAVEQIRARGGKAFALSGDLRDDGFARGIVEETLKSFGRLDFVWNHVGHPASAQVEDEDMENFALALDINLRSVFNTTAATIRPMREAGGGSILFTSSTSGLVASANSPIYTAAKFGVLGLMRGLARRFAKEGIRCNAVCPGPVDTPMLRSFVARPDQNLANDVEDLVAKRGALTPMGRNGKPHEIANAALFLISDEASFITGVALPVDGGSTA